MPGETVKSPLFIQQGGEVHTAESKVGLEMLGEESIENVEGHQVPESLRKRVY